MAESDSMPGRAQRETTAVSAAEITPRALEEAIRFERLIADIVARFVNLPSPDVDHAIEDAIGRLLEALDVDRVAIFELFTERGDFLVTHSAQRAELPTLARQVAGAKNFPWTFQHLLNGNVVAFSTLDEIPDPIERESVRSYGTMARVSLPLNVGGRMTAAIGFSSGRVRAWPAETLDRLRLVAEVFGGVLARKQAEAALRESESRFSTLADAAPVLIWMSGPDKLCTWFNRQWLAFVGHPLEHELGYGWTANVHPDDLEACRRRYEESFDAREPFSMEYRLRRHDGEWRWLLDTGTPNLGTQGQFQGYVGSCVDITDQKRATAQLEKLRDELHAENIYLRREVKDRQGATRGIVGNSAAIRHVLAQSEQVATTDSTVLLLGETGTGKELFAAHIHELSARRGKAMVRVNCAAIPATLVESELFGRERGAFTGALSRQVGRFELADRSTIFLDEIGDLPADVQVKLLRVLEERQFERLGSPKPLQVDTRIVAATHRNLEGLVAKGSFREDLFYRLNVFPIHIPPLRERAEDIPLLVWHFVVEFSKAFGKRIDAISEKNMTALQQYSWPGNIRELRNLVERSMIIATGSRLTISLPVAAQPAATASRSLKLTDVEKDHIRRVLESSGWRIRGTGGAAERLGMRPTTLETRMAKLGLTRPKP